MLIVKQAPTIIENLKKENTKIYPVAVQNLSTKEKTLYPTENKTILIMWATWCSPCKVEMERIQSSINDNKISSDQVYAMNLFEDDHVSLRFIKKSKYRFNFLSQNKKLIQDLGAKVTPTTYLFDRTSIKKASSGISIIGIYQLENFLSSTQKTSLK